MNLNTEHPNYLEVSLKQIPGSYAQSSWFNRIGINLRICISNMQPGAAGGDLNKSNDRTTLLDQGLVSDDLEVKSYPPSVFLSIMLLEHTLSICLHNAYRLSWVLATKTLWPVSPKFFTIWSFTEKVCQPLLGARGFQQGNYIICLHIFTLQRVG